MESLIEFKVDTMSNVENLVQIQDPRKIVTRLCQLFYGLGWVTGTGGGISIRQRIDGEDSDVVYVTPSGVQKEYIQECDLFVYSLENDKVLSNPANHCLKLSECTPLFLTCYRLRGEDLWISIGQYAPVMRCPQTKKSEFSIFFSFADAGAVMHSHSIHAAFLTVLLKTNEFR